MIDVVLEAGFRAEVEAGPEGVHDIETPESPATLPAQAKARILEKIEEILPVICVSLAACQLHLEGEPVADVDAEFVELSAAFRIRNPAMG
jgi:hypothetical protein